VVTCLLRLLVLSHVLLHHLHLSHSLLLAHHLLEGFGVLGRGNHVSELVHGLEGRHLLAVGRLLLRVLLREGCELLLEELLLLRSHLMVIRVHQHGVAGLLGMFRGMSNLGLVVANDIRVLSCIAHHFLDLLKGFFDVGASQASDYVGFRAVDHFVDGLQHVRSFFLSLFFNALALVV